MKTRERARLAKEKVFTLDQMRTVLDEAGSGMFRAKEYLDMAIGRSPNGFESEIAGVQSIYGRLDDLGIETMSVVGDIDDAMCELENQISEELD